MRVIRAADARTAADLAADHVADACRRAIEERGVALIAVSGGETPWPMLRRLAQLDLPWRDVHVAQVDERVVPRDDPRRNLLRLGQALVTEGSLPSSRLHAMPVEADDLEAAADGYLRTFVRSGGGPLVFDLVQLGLGADGHTASLVPRDPVLDVVSRDCAVTGTYQGTRRLTLTYPVLDRARERLWLVTGASKADRVRELVNGTGDAPAVRVRRDAATLFVDAAALPD